MIEVADGLENSTLDACATPRFVAAAALAVSDADGWRTVPAERLEWRVGAWKRVTLKK